MNNAPIGTIIEITPSEHTRRIAELEQVRADLMRHPVDAAPYLEELAGVEAALLELYDQAEA
jgi:hypothetical protein